MSYLALAKKIQAELRSGGVLKPESPAMDMVIDDRTIALLIDSTILGAPIWFAFDDSFDPEDGLPVFYAHELPELKHKTPEQLRKIYETKAVFFKKGSKVRQ